MLAPPSSNISLLSSSTASLIGAPSAQGSKGIETPIIPETNTTQSPKMGTVPFQNAGDVFASMIEQMSTPTARNTIKAAQQTPAQQSVPTQSAISQSAVASQSLVVLQSSVVSQSSYVPQSSPASNAAQLSQQLMPEQLSAQGIAAPSQSASPPQLTQAQSLQQTSKPTTNPSSSVLSAPIPTVDLADLNSPVPTGKKKLASSANMADDSSANAPTNNLLPSNSNIASSQAIQTISDLSAGTSAQPNVLAQPALSPSKNSESAILGSVQNIGQVSSPRQIGTSGLPLTDPSNQQCGVSGTRPNGTDTGVFSLSLRAAARSQDLPTVSSTNQTPKLDSIPVAQPSPLGNVDQSKLTSTDLQKPTNGDLAKVSIDNSKLPLEILAGSRSGDAAIGGDSALQTIRTALSDKVEATGLQKKEAAQTDDVLSLGMSSFLGETKQAGSSFTATSSKETTASAQSSSVNQSTDLQGLTLTGSTKELVVRLQGQSGETISVRLTDQGGQVQVAVRSSDASSASALRQDLSSLTSNLDRIGWKADVTRALDLPSSEMSGNDTSQSRGDSQDDSYRGNPDWEQQSRRQRNSTPDLWDEALDRQSN